MGRGQQQRRLSYWTPPVKFFNQKGYITCRTYLPMVGQVDEINGTNSLFLDRDLLHISSTLDMSRALHISSLNQSRKKEGESSNISILNLLMWLVIFFHFR